MLLDGRPEGIYALYAFAVAAVVAWTLVPLAERLARRIGAIDIPNERSLHTEPTPKLGGLAILIGILVSGVLFLPFGPETRGILVGAAVIAGVGVIDDVKALAALPKLLGQVVAAGIAVFNGVRLTGFTLPFVGSVNPTSVDLFRFPGIGQVDLGQLLAIFAIVAAINVINFIDGVDGLAAGVCVIPARPRPSSPRSRLAAPSGSCATGSRPPRASWGTPARTCWATCWP
jgi:UDP-GlcNAc:undecaprenyl-phosphate GlcNAc-1-phosphate transferase